MKVFLNGKHNPLGKEDKTAEALPFDGSLVAFIGGTIADSDTSVSIVDTTDWGSGDFYITSISIGMEAAADFFANYQQYISVKITNSGGDMLLYKMFTSKDGLPGFFDTNNWHFYRTYNFIIPRKTLSSQTITVEITNNINLLVTAWVSLIGMTIA